MEGAISPIVQVVCQSKHLAGLTVAAREVSDSYAGLVYAGQYFTLFQAIPARTGKHTMNNG